MMCSIRNDRTRGLTLVEVLVIIAVMVLLVGLLLPRLARDNRRSSKLGCVNHLKLIGLAARIFATDNGDEFPWRVSTNLGGSMEYVGVPLQAFRHVQVMSNELSTPKILRCPDDGNRTQATNFIVFDNTNISYFIGLDAAETHPQLILAGDSNLTTNGVPVGSGFLQLATNVSIGWTAARHRGSGNICLGDGSVQQMTSVRIQQHLAGPAAGTNRILIP